MLHEIFWRPFPASLNEKDLKVNLKSGKIITKSNIFRILFQEFLYTTYLKSDVLSMLAEVLMALITEAKHWF